MVVSLCKTLAALRRFLPPICCISKYCGVLFCLYYGSQGNIFQRVLYYRQERSVLAYVPLRLLVLGWHHGPLLVNMGSRRGAVSGLLYHYTIADKILAVKITRLHDGRMES